MKLQPIAEFPKFKHAAKTECSLHLVFPMAHALMRYGYRALLTLNCIVKKIQVSAIIVFAQKALTLELTTPAREDALIAML